MSETTSTSHSESAASSVVILNPLAALEARVALLEADHSRTRAEHAESRRKLRSTWISGVVVSALLLIVALNPASQAQIGVTLNSLNTAVVALQAKTQYMTVQSASTTGNNTGQVLTRFSGCNVQIDNGNTTTNAAGTAGTTASATGTGNLILGFNDEPSSGSNTVSGSHNLIIGIQNSYSSYGGVIAGSQNYISGAFASVIGGSGCTASGVNSSVSGGFNNTASGTYASAVGGVGNIAGGYSSTITGGASNFISKGDANSIFGGDNSYISSSGIANSTIGGYIDSITGSNNYATVIGYDGSTSATGSKSATY